jgi:radical SAM protein with 4Fe4S-binding SPASM domain
MKAKDISGTTPGGKRIPLASVVPLSTPFLLYIFPIYACNFKCHYCIFSVPKSQRNFISSTRSLPLPLFKQAIDSCTHFPEKLKVLRFVGMGEPLLHPDLPEMISYASSKNIANTIEVITNGSLLTPQLSDSLISSGLNRLIISIQGTSSLDYKKTSSFSINFSRFIENITYFYNHKHNIHLYIKIVDTVLTDKPSFYSIFGNICDDLAIEHTVPIYPGVDYTALSSSVTQFGFPVTPVQVCPQPFFSMQLNPDGNIVPCFSLAYPEIIGNIKDTPIHEIWNSPAFNNFRLSLLTDPCSTCTSCNIIKYRMSPEDNLNNVKEPLYEHYKSNINP